MEPVEGDRIKISIDGDSNTVTVNEYRIFANPEVRKGFKNLTAPLEHPGIHEVEKSGLKVLNRNTSSARNGRASRTSRRPRKR